MSLVKFKVKEIINNSKYRPHGYVEDVMSKGDVVGDELVINEEEAKKLFEKYREPNPIIGLKNSPDIWGPVLWAEFHQRTKKENLDSEEEMRWIQIFTSWIPCGQCKNHFKKFLKETPPQLSSQQEYIHWAIAIHNKVNASLDKPLFNLANSSV
jgi:hypothetical protein